MVKQVIVLRNDLNMRKGKMVAQGAHAAIQASALASIEQLQAWKETGTTKIVVYVKNLDELVWIYAEAQTANLPRSIIEDTGRTEFKEPTFTTVAIGPADAELIDKITGALPLL